MGLVETLRLDEIFRFFEAALVGFLVDQGYVERKFFHFGGDQLDRLFEQHEAGFLTDARKWIDGLELVFRH